MKEQFVTYRIAMKLKELGFDEITFTYFKEDCTLEEDIICINGSKFWNLPNIKEIAAPLWQQVIDWCDSKGLLVGTIIVDNLYKSTINKINYETELFDSRNESIKRAIEFAISYLQDNK